LALYLVTGGAGFIGSHTVEELIQRGEKVRVLDNLSTGHLENVAAVRDRVEFVEGDIRRAKTIHSAFSGVDYVVHLAAIASVQRSMEDPIETTEVDLNGTLHVLLAARAAGVKRVVIASTCATYGDLPAETRVETQLPDPLSPYAVAKLGDEFFGQIFNRQFGLEVVSLRIFNLFGPRQDPNSPYSGVLSQFIANFLRGSSPTIFGDGEQSRDFNYVANVVDGLMLACQAPDAAGRVINIGTGVRRTLNATIETLNRILGTNITPNYARPRAGDVRHSTADISLAREILGYTPTVQFEEGLKRTIEWFRTQ